MIDSIRDINFNLYDYIPIGICIIDKNYTIIYWNKAIEGWSRIKREDILGHNLLNIYPHLNNPTYKNRIDLMFQGMPPTIFSTLLHQHFLKFQLSSGEYQRHTATLMSLPLEDKSEFYTIISIENHTHLTERINNSILLKNKAIDEAAKRKLAEEQLIIKNDQLLETNAEKDKFFSIIAHDLKNPLGAFRDMTKLLHESYFDFLEEERMEFLELMKDSSNNLYNLLENLLEWSRSKRGLTSLNLFTFDVQSILNDTIQLLKQIANKKHIEIINNIPNNTTAIFDRNMIITVLRNLISNALKFTPENGIITISSEQTNDFIQIAVTDTGLGMDEQTSAKLFKINENVTTLGTNNEKGTGLGLILCKEFIEKNSGKIWVESELGKGSTFYFTLMAQ